MNNKQQAKLYYLYMMADDDVSANEKKLYTSICKELYIDAEQKKEIIKQCENIKKKEKMACIDVLKKNEKESYMYGDLDLGLSGYESDRDKASILWNLVNLGYADQHYTNAEREVIDFLVKYWTFDKDLYEEMIDVAETILALEQHKKWIDETITNDEEKNVKLKKVTKDIKYAQETIKMTISELD